MEMEDDDEKRTEEETADETDETDEQVEETDDAGETVDETDEASETDEAVDEAGETDEEAEQADPLIDALPEKTRRKIEKRIGKVVKQREAAKTQAAQAEQKALAAEEKLKNANFQDPETGLPFPSDLVAADEVKVLKEHQELKDWKRFLKPKRHEGYTDASGREFTAAQVEARLDEIDDRLEAIAPKALTIRQRAEAEFAEVLALGREALKLKKAGKQPAGGKAEIRKPQPRMDELMKRKPKAPGTTAGAGGTGARRTGSAAGKFDSDSVRKGTASYADAMDKVIG